jgi:hypothetical protein
VAPFALVLALAAGVPTGTALACDMKDCPHAQGKKCNCGKDKAQGSKNSPDSKNAKNDGKDAGKNDKVTCSKENCKKCSEDGCSGHAGHEHGAS